MGKGDKKTRRGKIFAGSHGKTRPKHKKEMFVASTEPKPVTERAPKKRAPKRIPAAKANTAAETAAPEAIAAEPPIVQTPTAEPAVEETATAERGTEEGGATAAENEAPAA